MKSLNQRYRLLITLLFMPYFINTTICQDNKPEIIITSPALPPNNIIEANKREFQIRGEIVNAQNTSQITINNRNAIIKSDGSFFYDCFLKDGDNEIFIKLFNNTGNEFVTKKIIVKLNFADNKSIPVINWLSPTESSIEVSSATFNLNGSLLTRSETNQLQIYQNNVLIKRRQLTKSESQADIIIDETVDLHEGLNQLKIVVSDDKSENTYQFKITQKSNQQLSKVETPPIINESKVVVEKTTNKSIIKWQAPASSNVSTSFSTYTLKGAIDGNINVKGILIYVDNVLQKQTNFNKTEFRSATPEIPFEETLQLKEGKNIVKVVIESNVGSNTSDFIITYNLFESKNYALLIGVQDYDDPKITTLAEPVNDASKLYNTLITYYTFDKENIILLKNPSKSEIIGALYKLKNNLTSSDNLLIFYAGHGVWDESMQTGYWLPRDAYKDNPVNWLPNSELKGYIRGIQTRHTLMITDACFSGGLFVSREAFRETPSAVYELFKTPSKKAITSGTLNIVPDKSVFMKYLIKYLKENNQKYLSTSQLFYSFRDAVVNNSPIKQLPQFEVIRETGDEGGEFIFIHK
jgi:hypothetical protein